MNSDHVTPLTREENRFARQLKAFLQQYFPFQIETRGGEPFLLPFEVEQSLRREAARGLAERMLTGVAVENAKTWRRAARASLKGKQILAALKTENNSSIGRRVQELLAANAKLIEGLPDQLLSRAQLFIAREQQKGRRADAIAADLRKKLPKTAESSIRLLARTEVARADTALMQARSERLNLNYYAWETSRDRRVRPAHEKMSGLLVAWNDPPSPEQLVGEKSSLGHYHAGQTFNCRCLALPLVELSEVRWPHKVYAHGHIHLVSRAQFERLSRGNLAVA